MDKWLIILSQRHYCHDYQRHSSASLHDGQKITDGFRASKTASRRRNGRAHGNRAPWCHGLLCAKALRWREIASKRRTGAILIEMIDDAGCNAWHHINAPLSMSTTQAVNSISAREGVSVAKKATSRMQLNHQACNQRPRLPVR